jgi:hypothetical protein
MRRRKIRWFSGQGGSLVIAMVYIGLLRWLGESKTVTAVVLAYLLVGGLVFVFQLLREARQIYQHQEIVITNLRTIIAGNDEDKAQSLSRVRDSRKRREAHMLTNHESQIAIERGRTLNAERELAGLVQLNEPDVMLEFSSPGPFVLRNYGAAACKIRVKLDTASRGCTTNGPDWYAIDFRVVPDLHAEPIPIEPDVTPTTWARVFGEKDDPGLINILGVLARLMASDLQHKEHPGYSSSSEADMILAAMEPIRFPMSVTYCDRNGTGQWIRSETLVYEPRSRFAYIEHGERAACVVGHEPINELPIPQIR